MVGPLLASPPNKRTKKPETTFKTATTGVKIIIINLIKRHTPKAIDSAFCVAKDLGVISPKIKITNVTTPVAIATPVPSFPSKLITKDVVNEEAAILTRLFPTSTELNKRV